MHIHFEGFGRPLWNSVSAASASSELIRVKSLG
jgi:hypothetical protein